MSLGFLVRTLLSVSVRKIYSVKLVNWKHVNLTGITVVYLCVWLVLFE